MTVEIKLKNEKKLLKKIRQNPEVFGRNFQTGLKKIGAIALTESFKRTPADTGRLRSSLNLEVRPLEVSVKPDFGSRKELEYAGYVHDGTGVYGPRKKPIRPKRKKVLRFKTREGNWVSVRQVKGQRPQPFFKEAMPVVKRQANRIIKKSIKDSLDELRKP